MAALWGQDIDYGTDRWPANTGRKLTDEEMDCLTVPDYRSHWIYEDLLRQMEIIKGQWGIVQGELNLQGVLNTAFRLRGEDLFADRRRRRATRAMVCLLFPSKLAGEIKFPTC